MTSETITYNNKKVIKKTNSNGEVCTDPQKLDN